MDILKGSVILIGKDPGTGKLLAALEGSGKGVAFGLPGSVPASVSRCKPTEGVAHAKLTFEDDGSMILTNLKPRNVTYVNGTEIRSKRVTPSCRVELGLDRYRISLPEILDATQRLTASPTARQYGSAPANAGRQPARQFNIRHLQLIWDDLQSKKRAIQAKQKRINLIRSGCGLFTVCAMPCIVLFGPVGYVLTGIGIVGNFYSFIGLKNDNTTDVVDRLNDEFQERYVCPNPDCNKFLGNISYRLLKRQYSMHCPYCKCEYVER